MADAEDLRRRDDAMIADFDKRLALIERTRELEHENSKARAIAVDKSFDTVGVKLDRILDGQNDAAATPAGRVLLGKLAAQDLRIDGHDAAIDGFDTFRDEFRGAFRTLRGLVIILTAISAALSIIAFVR
jgi:hypothetical protein